MAAGCAPITQHRHRHHIAAATCAAWARNPKPAADRARITKLLVGRDPCPAPSHGTLDFFFLLLLDFKTPDPQTKINDSPRYTTQKRNALRLYDCPSSNHLTTDVFVTQIVSFVP